MLAESPGNRFPISTEPTAIVVFIRRKIFLQAKRKAIRQIIEVNRRNPLFHIERCLIFRAKLPNFSRKVA